MQNVVNPIDCKNVGGRTVRSILWSWGSNTLCPIHSPPPDITTRETGLLFSQEKLYDVENFRPFGHSKLTRKRIFKVTSIIVDGVDSNALLEMGWAMLLRVQDVAQACLACCLARPGFQVCWIVAKTWERQASPSHHLDTKDTHLPHPSVHNNIVFVFVYAFVF